MYSSLQVLVRVITACASTVYIVYTHICITLCCRCFNVRLSLRGVDVTSVGIEVHVSSVCWNTAESR